MKMKTYSKIAGVGHYVPPKIITNDDLAKIYGIDTSDEWITQRSGIKQRHFVDEGTTNTDLAIEASKIALQRAGISKDEIDLVIYATLSPDHDFPGNGCFFQSKFGLKSGTPAIDVRNQCSGFLYSLSIANSFIKAGTYKKILVIGSEIHSRGLNLTTQGRDVAVLFGDGAGACVVVDADEKDTSGIYDITLHADGAFAKELWLEAPGNAFHPKRITKEMIDDGRIYPKMNGKLVFLHAVRKMPEALNFVLEKTGIKTGDIDLFVPHQANIRINEAVAEALNIPKEKCFNTIDRFGNTTAATIPIGLSCAVEEGKLKSGMLVAMAAFGSGFTWAAGLMRW
jgi:3-oxoacyl-[acyl-carrier-protein] synthase-3